MMSDKSQSKEIETLRIEMNRQLSAVNDRLNRQSIHIVDDAQHIARLERAIKIIGDKLFNKGAPLDTSDGTLNWFDKVEGRLDRLERITKLISDEPLTVIEKCAYESGQMQEGRICKTADEAAQIFGEPSIDAELKTSSCQAENIRLHDLNVEKDRRIAELEQALDDGIAELEQALDDEDASELDVATMGRKDEQGPMRKSGPGDEIRDRRKKGGPIDTSDGDIVKRLRELADEVDVGYNAVPECAVREAADEIEQLHKTLAEYVRGSMKHACDKFFRCEHFDSIANVRWCETPWIDEGIAPTGKIASTPRQMKDEIERLRAELERERETCANIEMERDESLEREVITRELAIERIKMAERKDAERRIKNEHDKLISKNVQLMTERDEHRAKMDEAAKLLVRKEKHDAVSI